jgi:hypothetical protein
MSTAAKATGRIACTRRCCNKKLDKLAGCAKKGSHESGFRNRFFWGEPNP